MSHQNDEVGAPGKKKRKKKKKKTKGAGEDAEAESGDLKIYQEPPKFEVNTNAFIGIFKIGVHLLLKCQMECDLFFSCFVLSCQDEEEFPGLTLALIGTDRSSHNAAKLCNEVH